MLDLLVKVIKAQQGVQDALTEEQREALAQRLAKGEVNRAQAIALLTDQTERGDLEAVTSTMEYLAAMGMANKAALKLATDCYLEHRHYEEAQRYAQMLCYEHDRYGPSLRLLAILDTLNGDYTTALVHFDEFIERNKVDAQLLWFQMEAQFRGGAFASLLQGPGADLALRPDLEDFLARRAAGKGFSRFSWHGAPTRNGQIFDGVDTHAMQRFLRDVMHTSLQRTVADLPSLDRLINTGTYVSDYRQYGYPEVWIPPASFEMTLTGDCEDFALWAWVNLCRLGYPARFVVGGWYDEQPNHAWVTIHRGGSIEVLECTPQGYNPLIGARQAVEYRPWWSVDRQLFCYRH